MKEGVTINRSTAQRLIALRKKYNFSQSEVARLIGVTPALISAYEKTERNPSIEKLIALADIYHTSTDYILGREVISDYSTVINADGLSPLQIQLIRNLIETMTLPNDNATPKNKKGLSH